MSLALLQWIQGFHASWLDSLLVAYSNLYGKPVYALAAIAYWWWPRRQARWLVALLCANQWLNSVLKFTVGTERPADGVRHLVGKSGTGPSFPSGHVQGTTVILGTLALMQQRRWLWGLATGGVLLMAYARMYTGYHWPVDVLGGAAIGVVLLVLWYRLRGKDVTKAALQVAGAATVARNTVRWMVGVVVAPAVLLLLVHPYGLVVSTDMESTENALTVLGLMAGYLAGSFAEERWVAFDAQAGGRRWQWLKLLVGAVVLGACFGGAELLLHGEGLMRYGRYVVIGMAATLLTPWIFTRILRLQAGQRPSVQA